MQALLTKVLFQEPHRWKPGRVDDCFLCSISTAAHQVEKKEFIHVCTLPQVFGVSFCHFGKADLLFGFVAVFEPRLTTDYCPSVLACLLLGLDLLDQV